MNEFNELFDDHLFNLEESKEKTIQLKEGERRMVSILFADVKGFTALSEKLDHEDIQTLMDHIMKIFTHSVEIHGGYVDKYTGDQIMALYGAKVASEVDTERAISTGLDILLKLKKFNDIALKTNKYKDTNINLSIRVGIHTGMVTTGKIGKEREGDYTVYGDAVNLASRMETNAPENHIMIPEYTMNLVRNSFIFKDHNSISVKGKKDDISVFLVLSKKDKEVSHITPFIGREKEYNELNKIYTSCNKYLKIGLTEKLSFIGIHAEAGVGKSRLIYEFLSKNTNFNMNLYSIGTCSNISSQPYHLFTSLIKDSFEISVLDSESTTKEKFENGINYLSTINNKKNESLMDAKIFLGFLLGIKYKDPRLSDKNELFNHFRISIRVFLESLCIKANQQGKSFIIILEDLHWIDKMSHETLQFLLQTFNIQDKRDKNTLSIPLFLCTYRNEYKPNQEILSESKFYDIELLNLPKEHSIKLIEKLAENINISKDKIVELYNKSQGNPFFIEEWINLLKESHLSEKIDTSRDLSNEYNIPNTLNSLILSRIDSLEKDLKLLLQKATIIGEDFFIKILSLLENKLGINDDIEKPVNNLESENFIQHYLREIDHYRFKHILTRDVAYSTILKSNKKVLHKAVGEVIEDNFQDIIEKFYYDLAVHYDSSNEYEKALDYLNKSGKKYNEIVDKKSALKCYERIIKIIEENKLNDNITLYNAKINVANIYSFLGDTNRSLNIINSLIALKINDKETIAKLYYNSGIVNDLQRNNETAITHYTKSKDLFNDLKNNSMKSELNKKIGLTYLNIGNLKDSMEMFEKHLTYSKKENNQIEIAYSYGNIGSIHLHQGKLDEAYKLFEDQYEISKKFDSKLIMQVALGNMALINNIRGKYSQALNKFNEILIISEDINDRLNISKTYGNIGIAHKNLGEYDEAIKNYGTQLEIARKSGFNGHISNSYINAGICYHKKGDFTQSDQLYSKAEQSIIKNNDKILESILYGSKGLLYLDTGDLEKSQKEFNKSLKIFKALKNERGVALNNLDIAKLLVIKEDFKQADNIISTSSESFKKMGDLPYYSQTSLLHSKIKRHLNQFDNAKDHINKAISASEKLHSIELSNSIIIEKYIIDLHESKSDLSKDKLLILADKDISKEHRAYIHYNIWIFLQSNSSKKISLSIYEDLYKTNPKFEFQLFIKNLA